MRKLHAAREQRDAAVGVRARRTVFQVAPDGTAHGRQLTADLVVAARQQAHLQEAVAVAVANDAVVKYRLLRPGLFCSVGIALVLLLVAHQPVGQRALGLAGRVLHNGPVGLVHLALGKHPVQSAQRLRRAGKDHQSAHGPVEPVHHAQEHVARLLVLLLQIVLHQLRQRPVARLVALHYFAALLGDDDDMVVLVDYLHVAHPLPFAAAFFLIYWQNYAKFPKPPNNTPFFCHSRPFGHPRRKKYAPFLPRIKKKLYLCIVELINRKEAI